MTTKTKPNARTHIRLESHKGPLPICIPNHSEHEWQSMVAPSGHRSGEHEDRCVNCGLTISYDDSD